MPTSATGIWTNNHRQSGFTLLEVMITLVLIGIITTFAVLSLRGSSDSERLANEARRLVALLELNRQEAILRGEQRGVFFTERGYSFFNRERKEWLPLSDSTLLKDYRLPAGLQLALWVEDRKIKLDDKTSTPQVLLLSSGETTDFRVSFSSEDKSTIKPYNVSADATGTLHYGPAR